TILTLFGLPAGSDMPGRVLTSAFSEPAAIPRIQSWEAVPGECGMHKAAGEQDVWEAAAVIAQLADLGYIDTIGADARQILQRVEMDRKFNLARVHMGNGGYQDATPLLEELVREKPDQVVYALNLAQCYQHLR